VTSKDAFVHVSGHPGREELRRMYELIRPGAAVPVHGELRHLRAHAGLARDCGVGTVAEVEDGVLLRISERGVERLGEIRSGRLGLDGGRPVRLDSDPIRARRRLSGQGVIAASIVLDGRGRLLTAPRVSSRGIAAEDGIQGLADELAGCCANGLRRLSAKQRLDDGIVEEAVRAAMRRVVRAGYGRRPRGEVHVMRLDGGQPG